MIKVLVALSILGVSYFGLTQIIQMPITNIPIFVWVLGIFTGLAVDWILA